MKAPATIRFFCPAVEWTAMQGPPLLNYWAFRGWRYLKALQGSSVCAITALRNVLGVDLAVEASPWYELRDLFGGPVADRYVNVVCGIPTDARNFHTAGVPNVAITGLLYGGSVLQAAMDKDPKVTEKLALRFSEEMATLKQYDAVFCPTARDIAYLMGYGVKARCVLPDDLPSELERFNHA